MSKASYHSLARLSQSKSAKAYKVGMEIEKEDLSVLDSINYRQVQRDTGWAVEGDASLDSRSGFEAVSPVFDLKDVEKINESIQQMQNVINAEQSWHCGGHIHLSVRRKSPRELFDEMCYYFPLLFAMYKRRIANHYCQVGLKTVMRASGEKHQAIAIRENTLEFRIFPSPKNTDILKFRLDLLRIMTRNKIKSYDELLKSMTNVRSELFKHLRKVYPTVEKMVRLIGSTIEMVQFFDGIDLSANQNMVKLEKRIAKHLKKDTATTETLSEE